MTGFVKSSVAKRFTSGFQNCHRSLKFIKWVDAFDTNILSYIIYDGVATPLLSVEREVRQGGSYFTLLFISGSAIKQNEGNY